MIRALIVAGSSRSTFRSPNRCGRPCHRTPLAGVQESAAAAERAYRAAKAQDRFGLHIQPNTGHAFSERAEQIALDWFVRWLHP